MAVIKYKTPDNWIKYDVSLIASKLLEAATLVKTLSSMPYKLDWVEELQEMQLRREVSGTTKIEGAEFTQREFDIAVSEESPEEMRSRSQRQVNSAMKTYRWIATLDEDIPVDAKAILNIHAMMIRGADDDHCEPGVLRREDENVTFGSPLQRGSEGGTECSEAFAGLIQALSKEFSGHNGIIQALAAHYHLAALHPFLDGNGRTARAVESLLLKREGLKDINFIAMSNYYHEEKRRYLEVLSEVRKQNYDLTPFLLFGLDGIISQSAALLEIITENIKVFLFRKTVKELFGSKLFPRRRTTHDRQIAVLEVLLKEKRFTMEEKQLYARIYYLVEDLKNPGKAMARNLTDLLLLGTMSVHTDKVETYFKLNLDWPATITEKEFIRRIKELSSK